MRGCCRQTRLDPRGRADNGAHSVCGQRRTEYAPLNAQGWDDITPVYLEFPGWSENTNGVTEWDKLAFSTWRKSKLLGVTLLGRLCLLDAPILGQLICQNIADS